MAFGHFGNEQYILAPGVSSFSPSSPDDIAGLTQWYKTDVGVTGTTDVTLWADQSGEGNDLVTGGSNTNVTLTDIGGIDFIRTTDGNNKHMKVDVLSSAADLDGNDKVSIFGVANIVESSDGHSICSWNQVGSGSSALKIQYVPGAFTWLTAPENQTITVSAAYTASETIIFDTIIDLSLGTSAELVTKINDFESISSAVTAASFTTAGETDFYLGSLFDVGAGNVDGIAVAEFIVYMGLALSTEDRQIVLNYLADKYSLTLGA